MCITAPSTFIRKHNEVGEGERGANPTPYQEGEGIRMPVGICQILPQTFLRSLEGEGAALLLPLYLVPNRKLRVSVDRSPHPFRAPIPTHEVNHVATSSPRSAETQSRTSRRGIRATNRRMQGHDEVR
jgi:hypothetical protein